MGAQGQPELGNEPEEQDVEEQVAASPEAIEDLAPEASDDLAGVKGGRPMYY